MQQSKRSDTKLLSICIPAYNRPAWLRRAVESINLTNPNTIHSVEIIVSDDSTDPECGQVVRDVLEHWPGSWKYVVNQPSLGMAANWNHAIQLATGKYVLVLHDDDFLLPNGVDSITHRLQKANEEYTVYLFGVNVVNPSEMVMRQQSFNEAQFLPPDQALLRLLSNSSFVRFPAIAINRQAFDTIGYFDPTIGGIADIDMWSRLFSQFGVFCVPEVTCAYTVHVGALTTQMFNQTVIHQLWKLFDAIATTDVLKPDILQDCRAKFFHQFILAGTFRSLRRGKLHQANEVMKLFDRPPINGLPTPRKWFLMRRVFALFFWFYRRFNPAG